LVSAAASIPIPLPPQEYLNKEADSSKRMFMKIAGVAGLGLAASSLLPHKADALVFGSTPAANIVGIKDSTNARINPAKEDGNLATIESNTAPLLVSSEGGYIQQDSSHSIAMESGGNLAAINTNTGPLTASGAGGYVRQDSTNSIAMESGGNLAAIATNTGKLTFDGSGNLKTTGGGGGASGNVGLVNTSSVQINPASDDTLILLRRMVKLMESQATVDSGNRQRITIDSLGTSTAVTTSLPVTVSGTVTTSLASTTITGISAGVSVNVGGQTDQMFQDPARTAYAVGIRNNLVFH